MPHLPGAAAWPRCGYLLRRRICPKATAASHFLPVAPLRGRASSAFSPPLALRQRPKLLPPVVVKLLVAPQLMALVPQLMAQVLVAPQRVATMPVAPQLMMPHVVALPSRHCGLLQQPLLGQR